jgi:hypothetical protein
MAKLYDMVEWKSINEDLGTSDLYVWFGDKDARSYYSKGGKLP